VLSSLPPQRQRRCSCSCITPEQNLKILYCQNRITLEFFATETWLYDSPPIPGEIYRDLLIKNQMKVDGNVVGLKNIKAPFFNVTAQKDDLVAHASSIALNDAVGSKDKDRGF
jgi:poly(3-hydroxyalkanoate) synthetase